MVGSGILGSHMTNMFDCSVYLLQGGAEYALIDAGGGLEPRRILANMKAAGAAMEQVKWLLLTHAHADHSAGARFFHDEYGLRVICPAEAAPWVESGDEEANSLNVARAAGVYPADFPCPSCPVARAVREGDTVQVGDVTLKVLDTPGHSRGHASYLFEEKGKAALFSGDVVFAGGRIVLQNTWDCSIQDYSASMAKLHALRINTLYPGHGPHLCEEAYRDIESAHAIFRSLAIPPSFI